ncbi:hypothetical protein DYB28_009999 [Aphanomyces astaci]|uniref:EamA domain-containing protein n=2 Tax=Aphanomyces astaci TaxID=112090 RepID=A0A9X8EB31_APHAT|nr:hypothetical protein DYB28_009999 [Aphanomyces astaci]
MMADDHSKPVYWDHFAAAEPEEEEWSVETRMLQRRTCPLDDEQFDTFEVKPRSNLERLQFWRHWTDDDEGHELVFKQVPYQCTELFESVSTAKPPQSHLGSLQYWDDHNVGGDDNDIEAISSNNFERQALVDQPPTPPHASIVGGGLYNSFEARQKSHLARLRQWRSSTDANEDDRLERRTLLPTNNSYLSSPMKPVGECSSWEQPRAEWNWMGLALLVTSVSAVSSVDVAFQVGSSAEVAPMLRLFWRVSGSCVLTFVFTVVSVARYGWPRVQDPLDTVIRVVLCALGFTLWHSCSYVATTLSSFSHANVLHNAHGLMLVAGKILTEQQVGRWEGVGAIVGFSGTVIAAAADSTPITWASLWSAAHGTTWHGGMVGLMGAAGAMLYLVQAKRIQSRLNFMVFMWCHSVAVCLILLPTMIAKGETFEFSTHPTVGLLGWATSTRWLLELFLVGVCDFVGAMGYLRVLQYFEPIVVSTTMLLEPTLASLLEATVSGPLPSVHAMMGSLVVAAGVVLVYITNTNQPSSQPRRHSPQITRSNEFMPRKPLNYGTIVV